MASALLVSSCFLIVDHAVVVAPVVGVFADAVVAAESVADVASDAAALAAAYVAAAAASDAETAAVVAEGSEAC